MISESWGVYSLGHLVIPFSVLFKLLINWKEKERGKSQMSGVILLLVISSLLTYALLPSGPFPLLPSSSFAFLRCTLGITQPAATLLSSSCCCYCSRQKRYWGHFKFQKVLTAAAKQTKGEKKSSSKLCIAWHVHLMSLHMFPKQHVQHITLKLSPSETEQHTGKMFQ